MNLLLFLGAGFSVGAGLPTQNQFLNNVQNLYIKGQISSNEYRGISTGYYLATYLEGKENVTLEDAFIALDYIYLTKNDNYKLAYYKNILEKGEFVSSNSGIPVFDARTSFLKVIEKVYSPLAHGRYQNQDMYETFFKEILDNYKIEIITTNYDLICENSLKEIQVGYVHFPAFNEHYLTGESYIPGVLKIHGSVDWKETPYDTPNIVPPTFLKQFDKRGKYGYIWNWAEYAIRFSEKIVFIGYSMPEIDKLVRYLIKTGLQPYKKVQKKKDVFIVNTALPRNIMKNYKFLWDLDTANLTMYVRDDFISFAQSDFNEILSISRES